MRVPAGVTHSAASSRGHGPERCEWPQMTCGRLHAEAPQHLGDAVQVAAAQRVAGEAALERPEAGQR